MRIVVSDTSALIDIKKGGLLFALLALPFGFVIPAVLLDAELLSFSRSEIAVLRKHMTVASLDGNGMDRVQALLLECPALSVPDGIAFVVAAERPGCIMLTADKRLRERAESARIESHGVLWVVDQIAQAGLASSKEILSALRNWRDDLLVRLPHHELEAMIERFS